MKKTVRILALLLLSLVILTACTRDLWRDAVYTEDMSLGTGGTVFTLVVEAQDKSVNFTVSTDKANLGEALLEVGIVDGENGQYGLYVKSVNGIVADAEKSGAWWGLYIGDKAADTGVSGITVEDGATYKLVYSK